MVRPVHAVWGSYLFERSEPPIKLFVFFGPRRRGCHPFRCAHHIGTSRDIGWHPCSPLRLLTGTSLRIEAGTSKIPAPSLIGNTGPGHDFIQSLLAMKIRRNHLLRSAWVRVWLPKGDIHCHIDILYFQQSFAVPASLHYVAAHCSAMPNRRHKIQECLLTSPIMTDFFQPTRAGSCKSHS